MMDEKLEQIRDIIQRDIANRGLARDPTDNLLTHCQGDFARACTSIARLKNANIAIVTGFPVQCGDSVFGETDGPLGALFLARAWAPLGFVVSIITDGTTLPALESALRAVQLSDIVKLHHLADVAFDRAAFNPDVMIAIERVGTSDDGHCYSMDGNDITRLMQSADWLFKERLAPLTIGIGDGGNEIGMGKIPRSTIARNIPQGELVACRTATDQLIVAGLSNWGAYALAAGVLLLRAKRPATSLFNAEVEEQLLAIMVEAGPLVDGITGQHSATVDGLDFATYFEKARQIFNIAFTTNR